MQSAIVFLSLGKYRTPLYFKKQDSFSSFLSGLASLVFVAIMLSLTVLIFIPIFNQTEWELDRKNLTLYKLKLDDYKLVNETCDKCRFVSIEQAINLIDSF